MAVTRAGFGGRTPGLLLAILTTALLPGCTNFDALLADCDAGRGDCASDAGLEDAGVSDAGVSDAGVSDAGVSDAGPLRDACPGFSWSGFCWVNPTPMGEDLHALLYESDQDIWVGGTAGTIMHGAVVADGGHDWVDYKVSHLLGGGWFSGDIRAIVRVDGGLLAFGSDMDPQQLVDGAFVKWPLWSASSAPAVDIWSAAVDADGALMAVGGGANLTAVMVTGDGTSLTRTVYATPGTFTAVAALPGGGFARAFTSADAGLRAVVSPSSGSTSMPAASPAQPTALWVQPSGDLWYAGEGCHVGHGTSTSGPFTDFTPCATTPILRAGTWSAALGRHVVVGEHTVLETPSVYLEQSSAALSSLFDPVVASPHIMLNAVQMRADGGGLVVGDGAFIVNRRAGAALPWVAENVLLRSVMRGAVVLDGGQVLVVGDDSTIVEPHLDGARPRILYPTTAIIPFGPSFQAVYASGSDLYLAADEGRVVKMAGTAQIQETDLGGVGATLTDITGTSASDITAVGLEGLVLHKNTVWTRQVLTLPDGGHPDLLAANSGQGRTWIGGTENYAQGHLYSSTRGSPLASEATVSAAIHDLQVSPSGAVWMACDGSKVFRFDPADGGLVEHTVNRGCGLTDCRDQPLRGIAVVNDQDVWAAGFEGVAYHWDGLAWTYVETGTRRRFNDVVVSDDGAGNRFLWLIGDLGTIIRKRLN